MPNKTQYHLQKINEHIDIAPVNSQEEVMAAEYIADTFESRGLNPTIQSIRTPMSAGVIRNSLLVAVFAGAIFIGIPNTIMKIIGGLLLFGSVALLVADYMGKPVLKKYGKPAESQNVIAKHEGTGQYAGRGTRPIIIFAHYDTATENILSRYGLMQYLPILIKVACISVPVTAILSLLNTLLPLSGTGFAVLWTLSILAAIPGLALGICGIANHFLGCTEGANDNKASLAAMFDVLDKVCMPDANYSDYVYENEEEEQQAEDVLEADEQVTPAQPEIKLVEMYGVRHGAEVIEALGILPETCEVEYTDEPYKVEADETAQLVMDGTSVVEEPVVTEEDNSVLSEETCEMEALPEDNEDEADKTSEIEPVSTSMQDKLSGFLKDKSWGKSSFKPKMNNFARRAALNDLPNPDEAEIDPLDDSMVHSTSSKETISGVPTIEKAQIPTVPKPVEIDSPKPANPMLHRNLPKINPASQGAKIKNRLFNGKKNASDQSMSEWLGVDSEYDAKQNGEDIGSWDNFEDDWKGGATHNAPFKVIDGNAEVADTTQSEEVIEELRDAIEQIDEDMSEEEMKTFVDEKLLAHDIWFVALGGSSLDHVGTETFLKEYRRQCRGSFVINLDCIGAGELNLLSDEGLGDTRKVDRRLARLLVSTAKDMGITLNKASYNFADTDATAAMRSSMRSATLMGMDGKVPALSGTLDDISENLDVHQISQVADLVAEVIRRS